MLALDGIRVLDLSRILAGPWCTQTLADLGADVWKIEPPGYGDDTRTWMPPDLAGESTYFMCCNRSKRSVAVDLKSPQGQATVRALAEQADVLVENFRTGALAKFGLDYEALAELNPRLIYCSISGYGRTGSRSQEAGYDFAIQAESGLMSITGDPAGEPAKLGVAVTDLATGMNAVQAILAAIIARGRTGRGQLIDIALLDSAVSLLANIATGYLATARPPGRLGNAHPTVVPYQLLNTADGVFALAVGNDFQFRILCEQVIDRAELASDPRFRSNRARVENRGELIPILQDAFLERTTEQWLTALKAKGVPAGKVRSVPEALDAPEIRQRNLVHEVPDSIHGTLKLMSSPLAMRGTPPREPAAPPRLGEHTAAVLREVLGLDQTDVAELVRVGAVALLQK